MGNSTVDISSSFNADMSTVNIRHCVLWTKWYWASAAIVAPFASFGGGVFGGFRALKITSTLFCHLPCWEVKFISPSLESVLFCIGPMTCLDYYNVAEMMLCNFRSWASGGLQHLILLLGTILLGIWSPRWEKAQVASKRRAEGSGLTTSTTCQPWVKSLDEAIPTSQMTPEKQKNTWSTSGINGSNKFLMF